MSTETLSIGSNMPLFRLIGTDDKIYSTSHFKAPNGLVIIFSCNHCPYVKAYEDRIIEIQNNYKKDVQIIAINSNDENQYGEDSFENMKKLYKEKKFNFVYLRDEDQKTAKEFGATHTPEVFLFNNNRKLIYHGKIDDNWNEPENVKTKYLTLAIDEMLDDKQISIPETFSIGCTIKWKANT